MLPELPQSLQHHVLAQLPGNEDLRTAAVSRSIRATVRSMRGLHTTVSLALPCGGATDSCHPAGDHGEQLKLHGVLITLMFFLSRACPSSSAYQWSSSSSLA